MGFKKGELPGNGSAEIVPFSGASQEVSDDKKRKLAEIANAELETLADREKMKFFMDDKLSLLERIGFDLNKIEYDESGNITEEGIRTIREYLKSLPCEPIKSVKMEDLKRWIGDEESD